MERNWNRGSANSGSNNGGEKNYKQQYSGGHHSQYRKKNDFSGPEYYNKVAKPVTQPLKKESLQVELVEDELMDEKFSWIKNGGTQVQSK
jgi:hypothetical protein